MAAIAAKNELGDIQPVMMCHPTLLDFLRLTTPENPFLATAEEVATSPPQ